MEQPVGLSFLGGFVIIAAAGIGFAVLARVLRGTTVSRALFDAGLGTLGGYFLHFLLPMTGFTLGTMIGWPLAAGLAAAAPIAAGHLVWSWGIRASPRSH